MYIGKQLKHFKKLLKEQKPEKKYIKKRRTKTREGRQKRNYKRRLTENIKRTGKKIIISKNR